MAKAFPSLALVSPLKKGEEVREAQFLLKSNRWGVKFYKGKIDGIYGPKTAEAARKAKFYLGYRKVDGVFGAVLRAYLVGKKHPAFKALPFLHERNRKARLQKPLRLRVLAAALKEVGYTEGPNNDTKFGRAYGWNNVAWCAIFCSNMIGFKKFKYAYCPYVVNDARAGRNGLSVTTAPKPGDLVLFNWDGDWDADHIGFFGGWIVEGSTFWTVEGNTSPDDQGSQSNGGGVFRRERRVSQVQVFVRY